MAELVHVVGLIVVTELVVLVVVDVVELAVVAVHTVGQKVKS